MYELCFKKMISTYNVRPVLRLGLPQSHVARYDVHPVAPGLLFLSQQSHHGVGVLLHGKHLNVPSGSVGRL